MFVYPGTETRMTNLCNSCWEFTCLSIYIARSIPQVTRLICRMRGVIIGWDVYRVSDSCFIYPQELLMLGYVEAKRVLSRFLICSGEPFYKTIIGIYYNGNM